MSQRDQPGELVSWDWFVAEEGHMISRGRFDSPELYPIQIRFGWQEPFDQEEVIESRSGHGNLKSPAQSEAALFKHFAELESVEEILAFADSYGLLHDSEHRTYRRATDGHQRDGEPVAYWRYWIARVRSVVRLLDGVKGDTSVMTHFRLFSPSYRRESLGYFSHPEFSEGIAKFWELDSYEHEKEAWQLGRQLPIGCDFEDVGVDDEWTTAYRKQDIRFLAKEVLLRKFSRELARPSPFSYIGDAEGLEFNRVGFSVKVQDEAGRLVLRIAPKTLLDLIWLQAAQAATGGRDYRRCASCSRWFAVMEFGRKRRSDRIYCSAACKTRAFRDKQAKEQEKKA